MKKTFLSLFQSIRSKLILIFIIIKVVPLVIMAWYVLSVTEILHSDINQHTYAIEQNAQTNIDAIADIAIADSIDALDSLAQDSIEQLTYHTAQNIANFLYERDNDIKVAAQLEISSQSYTNYISQFVKPVIIDGEWQLSEDKTEWVELNPNHSLGVKSQVRLEDNAKNFHSTPVQNFTYEHKPLYLSMSFIDLNGNEQVKVTNSELLSLELKDVSSVESTFLGAEDYFAKVAQLEDTEIYVSPVIGEYVFSKVIGRYIPAKAEKVGLAFEPTESAYAGKENPLGKKFAGIVRWVTPVIRDNKRIGYVSLVLDHTHIMEFTDTLVPTSERITHISDAATGNYAFMWDNKGRNISHPRDYFIVGYDKHTGKRVEPWLERDMHEEWQASGLDINDFLATQPLYHNQSLQNKPAVKQIKKGTLALDCRYLNFAPQCSGWQTIVENGGSGSFVIFWSGLWKLTTAAAIPYKTGEYGNSPVGFGFVTIGANINEFQTPALNSKEIIDSRVNDLTTILAEQSRVINKDISAVVSKMSIGLIVSTIIMIIIVIVIAVFMALTITKRITNLAKGISMFKSGSYDFRLGVKGNDELAQLTVEFNDMADKVAHSITLMKSAKEKAEENNKLKNDFLAYVSHELRTPLNSIVGLSDYFRAHSPLEQDQKAAALIHDNSLHLVNIVEDILDLAQIEAMRFKLTLSSYSIVQTASTLDEVYAPKAKDKGLDFTFTMNVQPEYAEAYSDPMRMRQILTNILDNALKFTKEGGISVEIDADAQYVYFVVSDTGIGIDASLQEKIFDKFYQAQGFKNREQQGIGLGLSLTKEIVHILGGEISCTSKEGEGTSFTISIARELKELTGDA